MSRTGVLIIEYKLFSSFTFIIECKKLLIGEKAREIWVYKRFFQRRYPLNKR